MDNTQKFYINGEWVEPSTSETLPVVNPATEEAVATIALGGPEDVDLAVTTARRALEDFSTTTLDERIGLLERIIDLYQSRAGELAEVLMQEMGAPVNLAKQAQVPAGLGQFASTLDAVRKFSFEEKVGTTTVLHEAVGVCGLITPWNWPLLLIAAKVAPAVATGCTMILKPSELAPLNALIFAEIMHEAGVPAGVFNLVNGDGPTVGTAISGHAGIDMVSFTGSTRAGIEVARNAAPTVKRVAQELGGKSANILLDDVDLEAAIPRDMGMMCANSGQSCNAGTRFLVPQSRLGEAIEAARNAAEAITVGDPRSEATTIGPLVSKAQYEKVQRLIQSALDEGASLVIGGPGRPEGLDKGYYVRPTVFANVTNEMTIAREEIFGPVITLIPYEDDEDAVRIANDSEYGLAGFVSSNDVDRARSIARRIRTGMVHLNGAGLDFNAPFGGYKQSGNGREYGEWGLREFLEVKSIYGHSTA